jgi:hypothetical protein
VSETSPQLSVVLVTDTWETIARTVGCLRNQTVVDRIELVVVAPRSNDVKPPAEDVAPFATFQLVLVKDIESLSWARAPGVRAASAAIVALGESHCWPEPDWAEWLLGAHAGPWAAVGPSIVNANPSGRVSWVNLLLDYGPWLHPTDGGEISDLPGHNSSYKKEVLLTYGPKLETMLEAETIMHEDLQAKGHRLFQEPRARVAHLNVTRISSWLGERFQTGRRFASARAYEWSRWRRAAYAVGSPLIPAIRLRRLRRDLRRTGIGDALGVPGKALLLAALAVSAVGELVGYAAGSGGSMFALSQIELRKEVHLRAGELAERV